MVWVKIFQNFALRTEDLTKLEATKCCRG